MAQVVPGTADHGDAPVRRPYRSDIFVGREEGQHEESDGRNGVFALLEQTADAAYTVTDDGEICSWNGAAERLFGYRASEVLRRNIEEVLDARDAKFGIPPDVPSQLRVIAPEPPASARVPNRIAARSLAPTVACRSSLTAA
jgi:PAS domain-containing protein